MAAPSTLAALTTLLKPKSVAIIGASEEPTTFGGAPIHNLRAFGYTGDVYAVNPGRSEVQGIPCVRSVRDIPGTVDTAVITVPARLALGVLAECADKGIPSATLVTSGFGEEAAGQAGQAREAELLALLRRTGMRLLGPNTAGLLNLFDSYVPRAAHNHHPPGQVRLGSVALVSQSGACGNTLFNRAQANGVGVSLSIGTGDQVDIDAWDLAGYCLADSRISVLMMIVESFGDVPKATAVARSALEAGKPIVLLKLGRSPVGGAVVRAHSGAIAGNVAVQDAALRDLGIIAVRDLDELWEAARLCEAWGTPSDKPVRLGVVSVSGGEAAMIADQCEANGITIPPVTEEFASFVDANFEYAKGANPFDPTGEVVSRPSKLREGITAFAANDFTHLLIASPVFGAGLAERYYAELPAAVGGLRVPVAFSLWPAGDFTARQAALLAATGHPVLPGSARAIRAIAACQDYGARRADLLREAAVSAVLSGGTVSFESTVSSESTVAPEETASPGLSYWAAREVLAGLGLPFAAARLCASAGEAADAARSIGGKVALKANGPSAIHKADHGLIEFGSGDDPGGIRAAYERLIRAGRDWGIGSVVVEGFANGQVQVIVGAHRDAEFGPVVVFGSGGGPVEFLGDVRLALAGPLSAPSAARLVGGTRIGRYLQAKAPAVAAEIATAIASVAAYIRSHEGCQSIDINPCIIDMMTKTWAGADARIV
jgi:acyl-CoA synthetase (NDP forming)